VKDAVERAEQAYREACGALSELYARRKELKERLKTLSAGDWRELRDVNAELEAVRSAIVETRALRDETRGRFFNARTHRSWLDGRERLQSERG